MSEVTTDPTQLDALAGEFVLGTLDSEERNQAQALLDSDQSFAARVKLWERRLGELHLMVEPVEPDGKLWDRIKEKVPQAPPANELKLPEPPTEATPPSAPEPAPAETAAAALDAKPADAAAETPTLPPAPTIAPKPDGLKLDALKPDAPKAEPSITPTAVAPALNRAPPPPTPPVLTPTVTRTPQVEPRREPVDATAAIGRRLGRWRAFASLMTLVVVAVAGLLAAWRFVPERVPPVLQPAALMRIVGVPISAAPPPRPPAPPESQYDE
jgi:anti-sigma-K factor RskA